MEYLLYALLGIGLAAACGFRVFVPLLVMSIAALTGHLELSADFAWLGSWPALIVFAVATAVEIGAYYVPWLDQALDFFSTPAAIVAGIVVTASVVVGMDPVLRWPLAIIAGGGVAGAIQFTTSGLRRTSEYVTAGFSQPVVASVENAGAVGMSVLSLVLPAIAGGLAVLLIVLFAWVLFRTRRRRWNRS
ncbi:MAG TPA: DUF4126 domain-containing protein [candidate division WOR-3 bacterium]|uniref:DUF4126 domain-containing protein n=1 Tax=candidate division WOR-3 bacterium TaxID=2052148 RepID=A0A7V0XF04_UNCW3|nr:DUF4126 domain-containing protein [candidate division WOR-3 bacterium]